MCSVNLKFTYSIFCAAMYADECPAWVWKVFEQEGLNVLLAFLCGVWKEKKKSGYSQEILHHMVHALAMLQLRKQTRK